MSFIHWIKRTRCALVHKFCLHFVTWWLDGKTDTVDRVELVDFARLKLTMTLHIGLPALEHFFELMQQPQIVLLLFSSTHAYYQVRSRLHQSCQTKELTGETAEGCLKMAWCCWLNKRLTYHILWRTCEAVLNGSEVQKFKATTIFGMNPTYSDRTSIATLCI